MKNNTTFVAVEKRSLNSVTVFKLMLLVIMVLTIALYIFG